VVGQRIVRQEYVFTAVTKFTLDTYLCQEIAITLRIVTGILAYLAAFALASLAWRRRLLALQPPLWRRARVVPRAGALAGGGGTLPSGDRRSKAQGGHVAAGG
jgi:hypothetical protein